VILRTPEALPVIGGVITWNAVVYGLLSGMTIVALVAAGTTVAAAIQWSALMRLLPARAATVAVAGSVAWTFLPQLATSWREIREAQAARGHRWRGARDAVPVVVPLLAGGLDRSLTTAEALEARGFGASGPSQPGIRWVAPAFGVALTGAVTGLYLFAIGRSLDAVIVIAFAAGLGILAARAGSDVAVRPTHYRITALTRADAVVMTGAALAVVGLILALQLQPGALRYEPYPTLTWPVTSPLLAGALGMLLAPAVLAPAPAMESER
jgi:energy-coupling factor transport system permease protein